MRVIRGDFCNWRQQISSSDMTNSRYRCLKPMRRSFSVPGLILSALVCVSAGAQSAIPVYDAVTIKPDKSGSGNTMINTKGDTYQASNITLKMLLVQAYGIRSGLITGLPPWAESAHFDVNAKILDYDAETMKNLTPTQRHAMVAALLVERFHVKVHTEVKTLPVYELVVAKDGPKITPREPAPAVDPDHPAAPPQPGTPGRGGMNTHSTNGAMDLTANAVKLENLVLTLSNQLDRNVIDKTGLTGEYDLHMKWTLENAPQPLADDAPPTLFTAIQEQLGLKLQPGKGPVDTLIVDHVEQPTEN